MRPLLKDDLIADIEENIATAVYASNAIASVGLNRPLTTQLCHQMFIDFKHEIAAGFPKDFEEESGYVEYMLITEKDLNTIIQERREGIQHVKAI